MGDIVNNDSEIFVNNIEMRPGKAKQELLGFDTTLTTPPILFRDECGDPKIDVEKFDFDDRQRNLHCINDRSERIPEEVRQMSTEELLRKLADSIKISINMQNAYGRFFVPFYSPKHNTVQLLVPLYLTDTVKLDNPTAAIILGQEGSYYVPETILPLDEALKNALVLNRYQNNLWLRRDDAA